jgi:hypothetical protein
VKVKRCIKLWQRNLLLYVKHAGSMLLVFVIVVVPVEDRELICGGSDCAGFVLEN